MQRGLPHHWGVLDDPQVQNVARQVARSHEQNNRGLIEADDLEQECLVLIAGTPALAERAVVREYGYLYRELWADVYDKFVRPRERSGEMNIRRYKTHTHEQIVSMEEQDATGYVEFNDGTGDYNGDMVKLLLPAVWDESYAYGLPQREDAPDADMPRTAGNKARANSHWAYIADIKTGWAKTPLTLLEKRALFMRYALAWTQDEIAKHEGIAQPVVSRRIDGAVKKITARLNGAHII